MNKTKILLNYPIKFQSIRKSFSFFDTYDKINDILNRKHKLNKKLKNMYGGGDKDTKQIYNLPQIREAIENMKGELGTLEANLIVGLENFPSFRENVNTMNDFLKNVVDEIKKEEGSYKDKYENINETINKQFDMKIIINGEEYMTKNDILIKASVDLLQEVKGQTFKEAYGIIKRIYEKYKKIYKDYYEKIIQNLTDGGFFNEFDKLSNDKINIYIQSLLLNDLFVLEYKFLQSFSGYLGRFLKKFLSGYSTEKLTMVDIINQLTAKIISIRDAFKLIGNGIDEKKCSPVVKKIRNTLISSQSLKEKTQTYNDLCYTKDENKNVKQKNEDELKLSINGYFVSNSVLNQHEFSHFTGLYEDLTGAVRVYIRIRKVIDLPDKQYYVSRFSLNGNPTYVSLRHRELQTCQIGNSNCCNSVENITNKIDSFLREHKIFCEGLESMTGTKSIVCPTTSPIYFGPFFGVFDKDDDTLDMFNGIQLPLTIDDEQTSHKPTIMGVLNTIKQVKNGYSIVLFGYGFSGSGKTYTLLGSKDKKTGDFGKNGLIDYALQRLGEEGLKTLECSIVEVYGERRGLHLKVHDVIQYLYIYTQNGSNSLELIDIRHTDERFPSNLIIKKDDIQEKIGSNFELINEGNIDNNILKIKSLIDNIDKERRKKQRVKYTSNNPESSRGHLFIIMKLTFNDGQIGYLTFVDMAGAENVIQIAISEFEKFDGDKKLSTTGSVLSTWAGRYDTYRPEGEAGRTSDKVEFDTNSFCKELNPPSGSRINTEKITNNIDEIAIRLNENNIEVDYLGGSKTPINCSLFRTLPKYKPNDSKLQQFGFNSSYVSKYVGKNIFDMFIAFIKYDLNTTLKQGYFINDSLNHLQEFMLIKSGRDNEINKLGFVTASNYTTDKDDSKLIFTKYDSSLMVKMLIYLDTLNKNELKTTKFIMIGAIDPNPKKCQGTIDTLEFMQQIKST